MKQIIRAKSAGFCMGVSKALHTLNTVVKEKPATVIATLGPIIHNPEVLSSYEGKGIYSISTEEVLLREPKSTTLVIRAHGIPYDVEAVLKEHTTIVDATCPKVKEAQLAIEKYAEQGYTIILYGDEEHAEVKGLCSYAREGVVVFRTIASATEYVYNTKKRYALAAQTTQSLIEFNELYEWLKMHVDATMPCIHSICDATLSRQKEVAQIAQNVEAMVIVGGFTSGNTKRLYDIAKSYGIYVVHIEHPKELPLDILRMYKRIGLSAGASTPVTHIDAVEQMLQEL